MLTAETNTPTDPTSLTTIFESPTMTAVTVGVDRRAAPNVLMLASAKDLDWVSDALDAATSPQRLETALSEIEDALAVRRKASRVLSESSHERIQHEIRLPLARDLSVRNSSQPIPAALNLIEAHGRPQPIVVPPPTPPQPEALEPRPDVAEIHDSSLNRSGSSDETRGSIRHAIRHLDQVSGGIAHFGTITGELCNLSRQGMSIETSINMSPGMTCPVEIDVFRLGFSTSAEVRWSAPIGFGYDHLGRRVLMHRLGLRFRDSVPDELEGLLQRLARAGLTESLDETKAA